MKKIIVFLLVSILSIGLFIGCNGLTDSTESGSNPEISASAGDSTPDDSTPDNSSVVEPEPPEVHYGLPVAGLGSYIKDADVLDDGENRILLYTTTGTIAEEDNVIATRVATLEAEGWVYGEESIAITGEVDGWDEFIGSASIVKGAFEYGDVEYAWLMAYAATPNANETQYEIGLAVATEIGGTWVKVGERALLEYDEVVYGAGCVGLYAPSLVNLNGESAVRIYYTYADIYGHFTQFVDINAADLDALYTEEALKDVNLISGTNQLPTNGNLSGGDLALMFPNADFAHCNGKVFAVKDYSPVPALAPSFADRIELGVIAEKELYTIELLDGWASLRLWDSFDVDMEYERLYSACIVSNAYGFIAEGEAIEVIYNVCDVAMDNADWLFSQNLRSFMYEVTAE